MSFCRKRGNLREFFDRLNLRIAEFMNGRYGMDSLNKFMLILAIILLIIGPFISPLDMVGWVLAALAFIRSISKNISSRQRENEVFQKIISAPKKFFSARATHWKNRKTTKYFKCDNCKQKLSVPKGKGKLRIICPKCGKEIYINS